MSRHPKRPQGQRTAEVKISANTINVLCRRIIQKKRRLARDAKRRRQVVIERDRLTEIIKIIGHEGRASKNSRRGLFRKNIRELATVPSTEGKGPGTDDPGPGKNS